MPREKTDTFELLERWHGGDRAALETLLERDLPWVERFVRRRLGPGLKSKAETQDFVQDAILEFLKCGPRFLVADQAQFRALLARIAENVIRGQHDRFTAQRRAWQRERAMGDGSVLRLDRSLDSPPRPSEHADREEWRSLVRLGLEFVSGEDRELILGREFEELSYAEIGTRLGISEDAARMRFPKALARLAAAVHRVRQGNLASLLTEADREGREA